MVARGEDLQAAVAKLAALPLQLAAKPWAGVLWNLSTKTMIVKHKKLVPNLFLHMVGEKPAPKSYDLLAQYRKVTGLKNAHLP